MAAASSTISFKSNYPTKAQYIDDANTITLQIQPRFIQLVGQFDAILQYFFISFNNHTNKGISKPYDMPIMFTTYHKMMVLKAVPITQIATDFQTIANHVLELFSARPKTSTAATATTKPLTTMPPPLITPRSAFTASTTDTVMSQFGSVAAALTNTPYHNPKDSGNMGTPSTSTAVTDTVMTPARPAVATGPNTPYPNPKNPGNMGTTTPHQTSTTTTTDTPTPPPTVATWPPPSSSTTTTTPAPTPPSIIAAEPSKAGPSWPLKTSYPEEPAKIESTGNVKLQIKPLRLNQDGLLYFYSYYDVKKGTYGTNSVTMQIDQATFSDITISQTISLTKIQEHFRQISEYLLKSLSNTASA